MRTSHRTTHGHLRLGVLVAILAVLPSLVRAAEREWIQIENPSDGAGFNAVLHTPLGWFAVGNRSAVVRSQDGWTWASPVANTFSRFLEGKWKQPVRVDSTIPSNRIFNGIAWNGKLLCAVGDSGAVLSSVDGNRWSWTPIADSFDLVDVAADESGFVAVSKSGASLRSEDCLKWVATELPGRVPARRIVRAPSRFLAILEDGSVAGSMDGAAWTRFVHDSLRFRDLGVKNGVVLASIAARTFDGDNRRVARSEDAGATWEIVDIPTELVTNLVFDGVVVGDSAWFLSTEDGQTVRSRDGLAWESVDPKPIYRRAHVGKKVAWHGGLWISVSGSIGYSMLSNALLAIDDRNVWSIVQTNSPGYAVESGRDSAGWWYVVSDGASTIAMRSVDLSYWQGRWIGTGVPRHLDSCGGKAYLWGDGFLGKWFAKEPFPSSNEYGFPKKYQKFACQGEERLSLTFQPFDTVATSTHWWGNGDSTIDVVDLGRDPFALRRFRGNWIAAGNGINSVWIARSVDGVSWSVLDGIDTLRGYDMATDGERIVIVGSQSFLMSSKDALTWERSSGGMETDWFRVTHEGGVFIAVGERGAVALSRDGVSWQFDSIPGRKLATSAAYVHDTLLVGNEDGALFLSDGRWDLPEGVATRYVPKRSIVRDGFMLVVRSDPSDNGAWLLRDPSGRTLRTGRLREDHGEVEFDLRGIRPGLLVLSCGPTSEMIALP